MCADINRWRTSGHLKLVPPPPQVTVVIPAYNAAKYLIESVDSVLAQSFRDFEVIVVDDGSTDETPEILKSYRSEIRCIRTDNRGPSSARNLAIRESRGELIAFQDADDVWHPEKLSRQVALLEEHPELGVA
ncbi:MAG TPA: glycosyltransferase family A protein, partial [Blastocatellia bacterium]|nr:glycosyltransferase family A protein [Blastocatellia bacterium]